MPALRFEFVAIGSTTAISPLSASSFAQVAISSSSVRKMICCSRDRSTSSSSNAKLLRNRLEQLRSSAAGGESLPMVLDDSFREIAREDRPALLELLVERSREQQIIFLTDDEEIATWAKLEALAGDMAVVEPIATNSNRKAGIAA